MQFLDTAKRLPKANRSQDISNGEAKRNISFVAGIAPQHCAMMTASTNPEGSRR
jgi:hypothetical protein